MTTGTRQFIGRVPLFLPENNYLYGVLHHATTFKPIGMKQPHASTILAVALFAALLLVLTAGCRDENGEEPPVITLALAANKTEAVADGKDQVAFTVTTSDGRDVSSYARVLVNDRPIPELTFSTTKPGAYRATADYRELTSNAIELTFREAVNDELTVVVSKSHLVADGVDLIRLQCIHKETSADFTAEARFYANGVELEGDLFKTAVKGNHALTAKVGPERVPGTTVVADETLNATRSLYLEYFTATWCGSCPAGLDLIARLTQQEERVIPVVVHPWRSEEQVDPFVTLQAYKLMRSYGMNEIPFLVTGRRRETMLTTAGTFLNPETERALLDLLEGEATVGIAVESRVVKGKTDTHVEVKAGFRSNEAIPNARYSVVIVESGMAYNQANTIFPELENPIRGYLHDNVFRAYSGEEEERAAAVSTAMLNMEHLEALLAGSVSFRSAGTALSLAAGETSTVTCSLATDPYWMLPNCHVVVLLMTEGGEVVNARRVKLGESIGY